MDETSLKESLDGLPLGGLRYSSSVGSTNDDALVWATEGAPDLSLVVADEQTAGRGRLGRRWLTPAGTALAFSLVLRPPVEHREFTGRTVGLAALAVAAALGSRSVPARIKWPNDVLVYGRKVAGILVESVWLGDDLDCQVVGIGVNVRRASIPQDSELHFPATSIENVLGVAPPREQLLREILTELLSLRPVLPTNALMRSWEQRLGFLGERVRVQGSHQVPMVGEILGLESDGSLRLRDDQGQPITVHVGDVGIWPDA
jgi:BirA family biotin operon repressor/biotin-[acetyl-CoA-carboxylase] ligase